MFWGERTLRFEEGGHIGLVRIVDGFGISVLVMELINNMAM